MNAGTVALSQVVVDLRPFPADLVEPRFSPSPVDLTRHE